jgi:hypothetical protein
MCFLEWILHSTGPQLVIKGPVDAIIIAFLISNYFAEC